MRWINNKLIPYYYSHLFTLFSIWLGYTLFKVGHPVLATVMVLMSVIKLAGIYLNNPQLRLIGLITLNAMWGVSLYYFVSGHHPVVELTYHFPAYILLSGVGISLRGRFNGR